MKHIVFLDRDGVINRKAEDHQYIVTPQDLIFNEGIFEVCLFLRDKGFEFVVITNQRGIARGLYSEEDVARIHERMKEGFAKRGIDILDIFYCPHGEGVCECRKPKDGMLCMAQDRYQFEPEEAILISDSQDDIGMGKRFGIGTTILVPSDHPEDALQTLRVLA